MPTKFQGVTSTRLWVENSIPSFNLLPKMTNDINTWSHFIAQFFLEFKNFTH